MIPRAKVGKGVTGAVRYVLGEGNDLITGKPVELAAGEPSRVAWIGGTGFGFDIETRADAELARRVMEFDALNQTSPTKQCVKDCLHLSLSWKVGSTPTRAEMEDAALGALDALGMKNAKALFVCHNDEDHAHVHIVASKLNPDTGRTYDLKGDRIKLSRWAEGYEREHGGIECIRRESRNELRDAIDRRDAGDVLEIMTKRRATLTARQLDNVLAKQIKSEFERAQFGNAVLDHANAIHLAAMSGGPTVRYTSRAVMEAELHVLRAAGELAGRQGFAIDDRTRAGILDGGKFTTISAEQAEAFRRVTGPEGLAIIDGQAGTGKSYTLKAAREAYEADGRRVIGLAPTNDVAEQMRDDGFGRAATVHAELFALNSGRTSWDSKTVVVVDEAAMLDTKLMAMITAHAHDAGAKLILVGDDRQLSSVDHGGMFAVLKERHGAASLSEVKRQHKADDRRASEMMAQGNFAEALQIYDDKGAIHWTRTQPEARAALIDQWSKDSLAQPDKMRFVFAYTNDDVQQLNNALRAVRKARGELGEDHELATAHGREKFAVGDRIQFTGTDKKRGINNGNTGTIEAIDGTHLAVRLDTRSGKVINFDAAGFDQFRIGLAGTIWKGQGKSIDQTYLYHSEHWRSSASYVGLTRHREKTDIFVARNTLDIRDSKDGRNPAIDALARQMGRADEHRAAAMFYARQSIGPVMPLTAPEIMARFGSDLGRQAARRSGGPRASEAAQTPEAGRATTEPGESQHRTTAPRSGAATQILGSVFDAAEKVVTGIFEGLAESIAPTPALTPEQEERQARATQEAAKQQAEEHRDDEHKERTAKILDEKDQKKKTARYNRYTGERLDEHGQSLEHGGGRGRRRSR